MTGIAPSGVLSFAISWLRLTWVMRRAERFRALLAVKAVTGNAPTRQNYKDIYIFKDEHEVEVLSRVFRKGRDRDGRPGPDQVCGMKHTYFLAFPLGVATDPARRHPGQQQPRPLPQRCGSFSCSRIVRR
jgi:hypothetical protein